MPFLARLDRARTLAGALGLGLLMCEAFVLAVFGWFAGAIAIYTGAPLAVGLAALLALAPLLQPQFIAFAVARHVMRRSGAAAWTTALSGAGVYVGVEWASPKLFSDTLGHGLHASALLRQAADVGGAPGLTFALLLGNECLWQALRGARAAAGPPRWRAVGAPLAGLALLVAALLGYGAWALRDQARRAERGGAPLQAGIVQAGIKHYERLAAELGTFDAVQYILDAHFALSDELLAAGPLDLLVWPETVYPTTFGAPKSPEGATFDRAIGTFASHRGVPLIFGAYDAEDGAEFNAAMFFGPGDGFVWRRAVYRKASLFPLTERVPAWLDTPAVRRRLPWLGTWQPGRSPRVIAQRLADGRTLRVAPLICYDAVDPRLAIAAARQGAEVIVTLSNDAWFAVGEGPHLHLIVAAFRSIETRLPQLRATNTGISAVISPTGELIATVGVDQRAALRARVTPAAATPTLMLAWGDWFGPTALTGAAVLAAAHGLARAVQRRR